MRQTPTMSDDPAFHEETDPRRLLLSEQLDITWGFATRFVLPMIDMQTSLWKPSANIVTVRKINGQWKADRPDEDTPPLPEATIGWLLWHVEWWWTNAARALRGAQTISPANHSWSGSTAGVVAAKATWDAALPEFHLDTTIENLMPTPRSAAFVSAWVNFELTKNIAEMHQLLNRIANSTTSPRTES